MRVPKELKCKEHTYGNVSGPWIEKAFYDYYNSITHDSNNTKLIYIPIQWTDFLIAHKSDRFEAFCQMRSWMVRNINPFKRYFTVVQHADGLGQLAWPNILIFGCTQGQVPIPLNIGNLRYEGGFSSKNIFCNFFGSSDGACNYKNLRKEMIDRFNAIKSFEYGYLDRDKYVSKIKDSTFTLCPRGYGPSSFRLYEAMAYGSIPVYIWEDVIRLPYQDEINWDELAIISHRSSIDELPTKLHALDDVSINHMRHKIKQNFHRYFTLDAICKYITKTACKSNMNRITYSNSFITWIKNYLHDKVYQYKMK